MPFGTIAARVEGICWFHILSPFNGASLLNLGQTSGCSGCGFIMIWGLFEGHSQQCSVCTLCLGGLLIVLRGPCVAGVSPYGGSKMDLLHAKPVGSPLTYLSGRGCWYSFVFPSWVIMWNPFVSSLIAHMFSVKYLFMLMPIFNYLGYCEVVAIIHIPWNWVLCQVYEFSLGLCDSLSLAFSFSW